MRVQNKMPHVSESVEQINLFRWAVLHERAYPELILLHHIPNGGLRNKTTAKRLKAEGVKPGVPDICLPVSRGLFHGLYIELKSETGRTSDNQEFWLEELAKQGYSTHVCYGWEEAAGVIEIYLHNGKKTG